MSLRDRLQAVAAEMGPWRCFHCGEVFTTREAAAMHFGTSEVQEPLCTVTAERYREVERQLEAYRNEADATSRSFYDIGFRAAEAAKDAEQKGYDRGIADAKAYPGELGLTSLATVRSVIEHRIQELVDEHGDYEPDTNVTNLPDWVENVTEELETLLGVLIPKKEVSGG